MIDSNVYLSRYPFRRLYGDEPAELAGTLRRHGVEQAWAGSFDALLHRDLGAVNARLAEECRRHGNGMLLPFGTVNPTAADWKEELRRCLVDHRMAGLRLHPGYHGYGLDHPAARELLAAAAERGMPVQVVCHMEDERTQHPMLRAAPVDLAPFPEVVKEIPKLRVQLLNCRGATPEVFTGLALTQQVFLDFAMIEGVHGVARLNVAIGSDRLVFGSYFPFFYFEAASLKIKEARLDPAALVANAKQLLGAAR